MTLKWYGDNIKRKLNNAVADALNDVASDARLHALNNHPNWKYRTGVAEGSIDIKDHATPSRQYVLWGSIWTTMKSKMTKLGIKHTTNYVWFLEFNHGPFLRGAADSIYPSLKKRIRNYMKR